MKAKISKKEIRNTVEHAMGEAMEKLEIKTPSRKTKKAIGKVSQKIRKDLKKQARKTSKKAKKETSKSKAAEGKKPELKSA